MPREALQEGLLVWCPWLAGTGGADANMDCMSTESCELLGLDTVDADSSSLGQPGVGCPLMHLNLCSSLQSSTQSAMVWAAT